MAERTHEFVSAGSEIDPTAPIFPFRQRYGYARSGKVLHQEYSGSSWPDSSLQEDEIRPGMDEVEGAFYDAANDPHEIKHKLCGGEYGDHNLRFWGFMFGALIISVLLFAAVRIGSSEDEFQALAEPELSPPNELVIAGLIIFYFLTAYVAYHNWKERNGPTFSHGTLFLMIVSWVLVLWWAVLFYAQHSVRDASLMLFLSMVALIIWIYIVLKRGKYDQDKVWLLLLSLSWLVYLFYYNIGVMRLLPPIRVTALEDCECKCFGDKDARRNRFERVQRNGIV